MGDIVAALPQWSYEWLLRGLAALTLPLALSCCSFMIAKSSIHSLSSALHQASCLSRCGPRLRFWYFAVICAALSLYWSRLRRREAGSAEAVISRADKNRPEKGNLTLGDRFRVWWGTLLQFELLGRSNTSSVSGTIHRKPALEKDLQGWSRWIQDAMLRHLTPFITEPCMVPVFMVKSISMEGRRPVEKHHRTEHHHDASFSPWSVCRA